MHEAHFQKLLPFTGQQNLQLRYMDCKPSTLSVKTNDLSEKWEECKRNRLCLTSIVLTGNVIVQSLLPRKETL